VRYSSIALLIVLSASAHSTVAAQPDVLGIIERSVAANRADWQAAPGYDYFEQVRSGGNTKTFEVRMILGTPYRMLVRVNGKPLPADDRESERRKMDAAIAQRRAESASDRANRIAAWEKDRQRDQMLMAQLAKAFTFRFLAERRQNSRNVFVLRATPNPAYKPPTMETQVLSGMQGELWIDKQTFQWVKVTAQVIQPVSIQGFLARVEPGTYFELEKTPVANGVWLPRQFRMKSRSKILSVFGHETEEDDTYFDYHKSNPRAERGTTRAAGSGDAREENH
jgi:hypothetical protein